ncbi:small heat-shock protein, putative [Ricinus communis]|uniref:Small heat-shock protein, putative n=2 Tax=Ricinus communis TaxID=3988 RepID=B9RL39_RICCO|nr:small heat-shock protein, putative [Ricinus communis]|eukprot:XP_002514458.1 inactive protein RESTRICTED TEV MOVEMENT 2 [Ricinus communis]
MATRTGTGRSAAIQYEDFQPKIEWKEEEGAILLLLHLPDYKKEQLKITYVNTTRVITILGERPITDNKWSRLDKSFSVPLNCHVNKIQAKFQNGILTITMPKITITQPSSPSKPAPASSVQDRDEKKGTPQVPPEAKAEQKAQKGTEETGPKQNQTDGKKMEAALNPKEPLNDTVKQKDEKGDDQKSNGKKEMSGKEDNSKKRKESMLAESEDTNKKRKEAAAGGTIRSGVENQKEDKFDGASEELFGEKMKNVAAAAKEKVKGLAMELSQERQALANIGVAVLVIAALGAYISYRYGPSGNSKD